MCSIMNAVWSWIRRKFTVVLSVSFTLSSFFAFPRRLGVEQYRSWIRNKRTGEFVQILRFVKPPWLSQLFFSSHSLGRIIKHRLQCVLAMLWAIKRARWPEIGNAASTWSNSYIHLFPSSLSILFFICARRHGFYDLLVFACSFHRFGLTYLI